MKSAGRCDTCAHLDLDDVVWTVRGSVFYKCMKHDKYTMLRWTFFCHVKKEVKSVG